MFKMMSFVIFALMALADALPDIGLQLRQQHAQRYNYYHPSGVSSGNNNYYQQQQHQQQYSNQNQHHNYYHGSNAYGSSINGINYNQGISEFYSVSPFDNAGLSNFGGSSNGGNHGYKTVIKQGEPIITKHLYFHVAPEEEDEEEEEEVQLQKQIVRPQKHYKIIFIKTPSIGLQTLKVATIPQTEEKTIVYVFSNKQAGSNVKYQTPAPLIPSKPEVFFIKYKAQQQVVANIAGASAASATDSNVGLPGVGAGTSGGSSAGGNSAGAFIGQGGFSSGSAVASFEASANGSAIESESFTAEHVAGQSAEFVAVAQKLNQTYLPSL